MATASTRKKTTRSVQPLTRLLWQDALLEWGIVATLLGALLCFVLLGIFEFIAQTTGVVAIGWLLLSLIGFLLFKPVFMRPIEEHLKLWTWGFAAVWLILTCVQFYAAVFVGQEISTGTVTTESAGVDLPLGARGTVYDLIVEGNFAAAAGTGRREGSYNLRLEKDGQLVQDLSGTLSETLGQQRLGRRGSATTRRLHTHVLHPLISSGEGTYHLTAIRVDSQLAPALQVSLYRDTYPQKSFWLLSALLLVAAYVEELWHAATEAPLVLVTSAAMAFVSLFHHLGVPPHSYQDIIGAVLVAAIVGPLLGWVFRVVADVVAKRLGVVGAGAIFGKKKGGGK